MRRLYRLVMDVVNVDGVGGLRVDLAFQLQHPYNLAAALVSYVVSYQAASFSPISEGAAHLGDDLAGGQPQVQDEHGSHEHHGDGHVIQVDLVMGLCPSPASSGAATPTGARRAVASRAGRSGAMQARR